MSTYMQTLKKHKILSGALILTIANFLTRLIGFFYRIYIAQIFSEESIGILHLALPVTMLFFSISALGMQSAISRFVAASNERSSLYLISGVVSSFFLSFFCACILYTNAKFIACHILMEIRCFPLLRIHALALPLSALHACINGYFFGRQKSFYPALSQILEQSSRVLFLYLFVAYANAHHLQYTLSIAILGNLLGEVVSVCYSVIILLFLGKDSKKIRKIISFSSQKIYIRYYIEQTIFANKLLFSHAVPISCNRILISIFNSLEATFIPNRLIIFGLTQNAALSIYGIMTGMTFPILYFPSSILNAICILLFPSIAKAQSIGDYRQIKKQIFLSCGVAISLSFCSFIFFYLCGTWLGTLLFHNKEAGIMISQLGLLCPLLYLPGVLITILNALGHTTKTLIHQIIATLLRLYFVFFLIPKYGIYAYFWGIFTSQLLLTSVNFLALHKFIVYNESGFSEIKIRKESHHGI